MAQAAVVLDPITYSRKRRSLAKALSQVGLSEGEDVDGIVEDAVTVPASRLLTDMEEGSTGVFEVVAPRGRTQQSGTSHTETTRSYGRRASTWMPAGFRPDNLGPLADPQTAADLPWLKAKRKDRFLRKLKVLAAWLATLAVTGGILVGSAYVMGLSPLAKRLPDYVAHQSRL